MGGKTIFFRTMLALVVLPIAAAQSCSSDTDDNADREAKLSACGRMADAQCHFVAACLPIFHGAMFDSVDDCGARTRLTCDAWITWPGTPWTAEKFDRCAEHLKNTACAEVDALSTGPCASEPGSLANGATCVDSSQCASRVCQGPGPTPGAPSACSTCAASGSGCPASGCPAGQRCIGPRCIEYLGEGAPCTAASLCAAGLSCLGSICTRSRGEGESCMQSSDCDYLQELRCVDNLCRKWTLVDIGAPCSVTDRCAKGGFCYSELPEKPPTCVAPIGDNLPCGGAGSYCREPARCVSGICQPPAKVSCP